MAKLENINLPLADEQTTNTVLLTVEVAVGADGKNPVTEYNKAADAKSTAEKVMEVLKPGLIKLGLTEVFTLNTLTPTKPISSVRLADVETGEVLQYSWVRKDGKNIPKVVEAAFKKLRELDGKVPDINAYVGYEVVADFDAAAFNNAAGVFDKKRLEAFSEAVKAVAGKFGIPSPLTCGKVLKPKADFHDQRWLFFDLEANLQLQEVLPTQSMLKPIRPEKKD